jgi:hypothetical protein
MDFKNKDQEKKFLILSKKSNKIEILSIKNLQKLLNKGEIYFFLYNYMIDEEGNYYLINDVYTAKKEIMTKKIEEEKVLCCLKLSILKELSYIFSTKDMEFKKYLEKFRVNTIKDIKSKKTIKDLLSKISFNEKKTTKMYADFNIPRKEKKRIKVYKKIKWNSKEYKVKKVKIKPISTELKILKNKIEVEKDHDIKILILTAILCCILFREFFLLPTIILLNFLIITLLSLNHYFQQRHKTFE